MIIDHIEWRCSMAIETHFNLVGRIALPKPMSVEAWTDIPLEELCAERVLAACEVVKARIVELLTERTASLQKALEMLR